MAFIVRQYLNQEPWRRDQEVSSARDAVDKAIQASEKGTASVNIGPHLWMRFESGAIIRWFPWTASLGPMSKDYEALVIEGTRRGWTAP